MEQQQQHQPGGHYSGANPVPTVKKFIENLDRDKKDRDREIEQREKARKQDPNGTQGDAQPHKEIPHAKDHQKVVTDPTTGHQVAIENVNKEMIENAKNPQVRVTG